MLIDREPKRPDRPSSRAPRASSSSITTRPITPRRAKEDVEFTRRFAKCGELIDINLLDHVIIGADTYKSLKETGAF